MNLPTSSDYPLILHGDCVEEMRQLPEASVHAVVTDPPYGINFMGKAWDAPGGMLGQMATGDEQRGYADNDNAAFGAWCETWLTECLRVLKPGGHLLAFGGTRTWHRLACAVEDAGFEIRDSIAWLYGSGFPKSLDVSKAIDRQRHDRDDVRRVTAWVATARATAGITNRDIDAAFGFNGMAGHWTTQGAQAAIPTLDQVPTLLAVLGIDADDVPDEIRALLIDLNGMKGQPGPAWFAREITQAEARPLVSGETISFDQRSSKERERRDIPATPDAERWQGWGTALKPSFEGIVCATKPVPAPAGGSRAAFEPVVVARKPLVGTVAANVLEHGTGALNIDGCRVGSESTARTQRGTTRAWAGGAFSGEVATGSAAGRWPANVVLDETQAEALDEQSGTLTSGANPTRRGADGDRQAYGEFGGQDDANPQRGADSGGASRFFFIAREDNPCHSTSSASTVESPSSHPRGPADSAPSDAATTACPDGERLTGSPSTSETPSASRPSVESGTTPTMSTAGASSPDWQPGEPSQMVSRARYAASLSRTATTTTTTSPSSSAGSVDPTTSSTTQASAPGVPLDELGSRFNYVAKADASERPRVNGTAHPTVKPLDLMRWLVRLVTPPGGIVLEPFAGSGTTVEACIKEDVRCVAIEREADYLPLIDERINRNNLSLFAGGAS